MRLIFFLLFIVLFFPTAAQAHEIHLQQTNGPSAGAIRAGLGFSPKNPNIIYVDRYKSTDGGNTWTELDNPTGLEVNNIAVDPDNPDIVYLATGNVIHKTNDGGKTWKKLEFIGLLNERAASSMAINPRDSNIVYVGTTHGELYASFDAGQTWSDISNKIKSTSPISRIAFNLKNAGEIYVSTGSWYWSAGVEHVKTGNGLFKSTDRGKTFIHLQTEFSADLVQDVDVLGNTAYVTTYHAPNEADERDGLYKSTDSGKTWKKLIDSRSSFFAFNHLTHVAINPSDENHIIVSISAGPGPEGEVSFILSYDGGNTWKLIKHDKSEPIQYTHELEITKDGRAYAVDYYRPFLISKDNGESWKWASNGIRTSTVNSLQIHPTNRNIVFAGTIDGALHKTYDGGKTWQRISTKLSATYVATIEFHPKDSDTLYFGVSGPTHIETGRYFGAPGFDTGLYATKDSGKTWNKLNGLAHPLGDGQLEIYDILVHPKNPNLLLVGTASEGVYRSEDGGKTWREANSGIPKDGFYWNVNFDGPDDGHTEIECKEGFKQGKKVSSACFYYATRTSMNLFLNPHHQDEIWYTTLNGIFISKDLGKSWQWLSDDLKHIHVHFMAFDPSDPNTIYVGTHQGAIDENGKVIDSSKGLLISRDGGKTWSPIVRDAGSESDELYGPGEGHDIRAVAVDPKNPNFVAVGTQSDFFISEDKGKTWKNLELRQGKATQIDEIRIDSAAKIIYLGTREHGVWRGILDYSSQYPALIEITGISAPKLVKSGERFDVIVSVDNIGGKSGSLPVRLKIGEYKASKTVQIAAADQASVRFSFTLKKTGTYEIRVNDFKYGEVSVVAKGVRKRKTTASPEIQNSKTLQKSIRVSSSEVVRSPKRSFIELLLGAITSFF